MLLKRWRPHLQPRAGWADSTRTFPYRAKLQPHRPAAPFLGALSQNRTARIATRRGAEAPHRQANLGDHGEGQKHPNTMVLALCNVE